MAVEWPRVRLGDCGTWLSGGTPSKANPEFWGGSLAWITSKDLYVRYVDGAEQCVTDQGAANGTRTVGPGTLLIVVRSMALANGLMIGLTRRTVAFNQDVKALVPRSHVDARFLLFSLWGHERHLRDLIDEASHGTKRLRTELLQDFRIPLPPIEDQRTIAEVLGAFDDKIESNRRVANAADAVWLRALTRTLREAAEVPVAELIAAGTLVVNDGYRAKNAELSDVGIPFVRAGNLTNDGLVLDRADLVPTEVVHRAGIKVARPWDTAFTSKGSVGRITLLGPEPEPFVYSPQVCFWRSANHERLSPLVLHAWMRGTMFTAQVDSVKGQTDMADYVSLRDQRAMTMALPIQSVQRVDHEIAEPMARIAWSLRREVRTQAAIRDNLLPKLVSGEIRVAPSSDLGEQASVAHEAEVAA